MFSRTSREVIEVNKPTQRFRQICSEAHTEKRY